MTPGLATALLQSLLGSLLFVIYVALAVRSAPGPARRERPAETGERP